MKKHETAWEIEGFALVEGGCTDLELKLYADHDYIRKLEAALGTSLAMLDGLVSVSSGGKRFKTDEIRASVGWGEET